MPCSIVLPVILNYLIKKFRALARCEGDVAVIGRLLAYMNGEKDVYREIRLLICVRNTACQNSI